MTRGCGRWRPTLPREGPLPRSLSATPPSFYIIVTAASSRLLRSCATRGSAPSLASPIERSRRSAGAVRLAMQPIIERSRAASVLFGRRNFDDCVPYLKGEITSGTILVGGEAVTAELEMTVDSTMGGKKALDMTR